MKKLISGIAVIALYLVIITSLLEFNIRLLFEWKSMVLVIAGMGLLSVTSIRRGMQKNKVLNIMANNAIVASFIVMLVFLFSGTAFDEILDFRGMIAIGCRPLLYGVIMYSLLHMCRKKEEEDAVAPDAGKEADRQDMDYRQQGLTKREIEIADLVKRGLTNKEIADEIYIAETTVKKHLSHIFEKLDIQKREEL